ncbi:pilus assembly protein PilL [Ralstonia nicotianae]|uniref:pilus assembly protein PilL n=1 Tax=Ralstonia pseudosolanacearum TaxID=1310165 RepID=UPI002006AC02|nr:pilus assembly protein PilL [Ralstonia pseudosolanacearum]MCK4118401.1 pilus assembly protein PilL [Ralstonia pseudosolanacearum]
MTKLPFLAMALVCAAGHATAADTDPLDFDYQVVAPASARPAMVFNDGVNTYVQPRAGQAVQADGSQNAGPYVMFDGVPDVVRYAANGQPVIARWKRANAFTGEPANPTGELPRGFAGFSGRIAIIGRHGDLPLVRAGTSTLPLSQIVRTLAPSGWTGTAQKAIGLTEEATFVAHRDENWLQALGRLLEQRNLYAEVDFERKNIALRVEPSKSLSIGTAAAGQPSEAGVTPQPGVQTDAPTSSADSLLAEAFDAVGIRDTKAGQIEIRFTAKPADLLVRSAAGKALDLIWHEAEPVVAFETVDRFTVSGGGRAVEVARVPGIRYVFSADNPAGVERVFERDNATYLTFRHSVGTASVFNEDREGSGELKDHHYKFSGIAQRLTVVADGRVTTIERTPEVRFYERAGRAQ